MGRSEKHDVFGIRFKRNFFAAGLLFDRQRLARERRLLNVRVAGFQKPRVGRY
jgi:hypothetical protein